MWLLWLAYWIYSTVQRIELDGDETAEVRQASVKMCRINIDVLEKSAE
ncbi:hypothetical protein [Zhongshania sp.]